MFEQIYGRMLYEKLSCCRIKYIYLCKSLTHTLSLSPSYWKAWHAHFTRWSRESTRTHRSFLSWIALITLFTLCTTAKKGSRGNISFFLIRENVACVSHEQEYSSWWSQISPSPLASHFGHSAQTLMAQWLQVVQGDLVDLVDLLLQVVQMVQLGPQIPYHPFHLYHLSDPKQRIIPCVIIITSSQIVIIHSGWGWGSGERVLLRNGNIFSTGNFRVPKSAKKMHQNP